MDLNFEFANPQQREFYYSTARNQCFSGAFNNGKTTAGCFKAITLLFTFPNYRLLIARERFNDLKKTTMQSFFKLCPSEFIASHNEQAGLTQLKNGSLIYWMHLDDADENSLRGLEINACLIDQAEEISEKVYDVLDSRIGRWDGVIVPDYLLELNPNWPKNRYGKYIVPSYMMLLCNPDTQYHFIYRKYHPDSVDRDPDYFFVEGQWDPTLGSSETYKKALERDPEWVAKYVRGIWGLSAAQIHFVPTESYLEYSEDLIEEIRLKARLYRVLDHGDSAPTCCLWVAAMKGVYIFYREYYVPNKVISIHRQNISDLSRYKDAMGNDCSEYYTSNWADPQIFKKTNQKDGRRFSVAEEYYNPEYDAPAIHWQSADNNEFATRNRINELLSKDPKTKHPITGELGAPKLYFIKASPDYPYGCKESIRQLPAQRRLNMGTVDGKIIYSDDRDDTVVDHAYDCIRYFVGMHGAQPSKIKQPIRKNTFAYFNAVMKARELRALSPEPLSHD